MKKVLILAIGCIGSMVVTDSAAMLALRRIGAQFPKSSRFGSQKDSERSACRETKLRSLKDTENKIEEILKKYALCKNAYERASNKRAAWSSASILDKIPLFGAHIWDYRMRVSTGYLMVECNYEEQLKRGQKRLDELYVQKRELVGQLEKY